MDINNYKGFITAEYLMGPNSMRVLDELLTKYPMKLTDEDMILDLGCGKGLTSMVLAKETPAKDSSAKTAPAAPSSAPAAAAPAAAAN